MERNGQKTYRTCCKRPQPDRSEVEVHQRPGKEPFVQFHCLHCGGRVRLGVVHFAAQSKAAASPALCEPKGSHCAMTTKTAEVTCQACAALLLARHQLHAPVDWRPDQCLAEDYYAL